MTEIPMKKDVKAGLVEGWKMCGTCAGTGKEVYWDKEMQSTLQRPCSRCLGYGVFQV